MTEAATLDQRTRLGVLKRETRSTLVLACTGGGLTFTWLAHLGKASALGLLVHGVTGALGGCLVGAGIARLLTGVRARWTQHRLEVVGFGNRVLVSLVYIVLGTALFAASYVWAIAPTFGVSLDWRPDQVGIPVPMALWVALFVGLVIRRVRKKK